MVIDLSKIQDTSAREVARSHSSCILSFDLIGLHQNKRFTSWKSFCRSGSQTLFFGGREATTGNASAVRRLTKAEHGLISREAAVKLFEPAITCHPLYHLYDLLRLCPGLCSSRARWPLAPNFCPRATRKSQIFHSNHLLGTLDFTVSKH